MAEFAVVAARYAALSIVVSLAGRPALAVEAFDHEPGWHPADVGCRPSCQCPAEPPLRRSNWRDAAQCDERGAQANQARTYRIVRLLIQGRWPMGQTHFEEGLSQFVAREEHDEFLHAAQIKRAANWPRSRGDPAFHSPMVAFVDTAHLRPAG